MANGYNAKTERTGDLIVYYVQTNEGMELSSKSKHDIYHQLRDLAAYWKGDSDKLRAEKHAKKWNSFKIWKKQNPNATKEEAFAAFDKLDRGESLKGGML